MRDSSIPGAPCLQNAECAISQRIARLTPAQLDVLELVAMRRTSKEIARELGISPVTVDQRLKRAQTLLGVSNRSEAARALIAARASQELPVRNIYEKTIYDSSGLFPSLDKGNLTPSFDEWNPENDGERSALRQAQAAYIPVAPEVSGNGPLSSVLREMQRPEGLSVTSKVFVILAIMILTLVSLAILVNLAEGMSRLL